MLRMVIFFNEIRPATKPVTIVKETTEARQPVTGPSSSVPLSSSNVSLLIIYWVLADI